VIASLTVLERGTGSINKAIALQGLTADLARAKNIDLAAAAGVVAKVFGGQETALRRAVPGLREARARLDLIRLAQAKMAGQAAANTTATNGSRRPPRHRGDRRHRAPADHEPLPRQPLEVDGQHTEPGQDPENR
jgi:hypothetical protein